MAMHLLIEGRVQGVGYRYALRDQALQLGLSGWVRNRADGSVEAVVAGGEDQIDALVRWAWEGPPAAKVTHVSMASAPEAEIRLGVFTIAASA